MIESRNLKSYAHTQALAPPPRITKTDVIRSLDTLEEGIPTPLWSSRSVGFSASTCSYVIWFEIVDTTLIVVRMIAYEVLRVSTSEAPSQPRRRAPYRSTTALQTCHASVFPALFRVLLGQTHHHMMYRAFFLFPSGAAQVKSYIQYVHTHGGVRIIEYVSRLGHLITEYGRTYVLTSEQDVYWFGYRPRKTHCFFC